MVASWQPTDTTLAKGRSGTFSGNPAHIIIIFVLIFFIHHVLLMLHSSSITLLKCCLLSGLLLRDCLDISDVNGSINNDVY